MKKILSVALVLTSFYASAAIELSGKIDRAQCVIKNNKVTRTQTFGKDSKLVSTQTFDFSVQGLDDVLAEARARVTNRPANEDMVFSAVEDGTKITLNAMDSKEATYIIQMIVKACHF